MRVSDTKQNLQSFYKGHIYIGNKVAYALTHIYMLYIVMGPSPGPSIFRARARNFEKGPCHARPKIQLDFLRRQRLFKAQVQLELNFQGSGLAEA